MGAIDKLFEAGAAIQRGLARFDGWQNILTGLGTRDYDKAMSTEFERTERLPDQKLEDIYHGNFLARMIVQDLIEEGFGPGLTFKRKSAYGEDPASPDELDDLLDALERWDVRNKFVEAAVWGRLYGRGALYPILTKGPQDRPVNLREVENAKLVDLVVLEKRDFSTFLLSDITLDPELWVLCTDDENTGTQIHHTRLIHFGGIRTSRRERVRMDWSDHTALQPVIDTLRDHGSNWRATVNRMQDASQGVLRLKGLFDMVSGTDESLANLKKRMYITNLQRSIARIMLVDADEESFEYKEVGFQGIPDVLLVSMQMIAAAAGMPMTKLFGIPPSGLGSEDKSGQRNWNKRVSVYRELVLRRPFELIVNLVAQTEGLGSGWIAEFPPVWDYSPAEEIELRDRVATADASYIREGVYLAEEVALARSKPGGWRNEIEIDLDLRQKLLDLALDKKEEEAENPPPDPFADPFGANPDPSFGASEPPEPAPGEEPPADDKAEEEPPAGDKPSVENPPDEDEDK